MNSRHHESKNRAHWYKAADFRTKKDRFTERVINVHDHVIALEIEGRRRVTYVSRAYIELKNGRTIRAHELEGYFAVGDLRRLRFNHEKHVRRVILEVSPDSRKRGYARLNVKKYQ